ncbi:MAG: hypothetical protein E6P95_00300 [Candidatus Moraniibacteriota bacterium]|nr:MAG: hypothetical protein E6P95_00300 [Candidatus Moranbacteria bacterium]
MDPIHHRVQIGPSTPDNVLVRAEEIITEVVTWFGSLKEAGRVSHQLVIDADSSAWWVEDAGGNTLHTTILGVDNSAHGLLTVSVLGDGYIHVILSITRL